MLTKILNENISKIINYRVENYKCEDYLPPGYQYPPQSNLNKSFAIEQLQTRLRNRSVATVRPYKNLKKGEKKRPIP